MPNTVLHFVACQNLHSAHGRDLQELKVAATADADIVEVECSLGGRLEMNAANVLIRPQLHIIDASGEEDLRPDRLGLGTCQGKAEWAEG